MGVLGFIAVFVLLVLIAKQWCLNVKETLKEEVQEEYEEMIRREKKRGDLYKMAYEDVLYNTKFEVVHKGNWEGLI